MRRSMLEQNRLLRRYALGDFRQLVQEISRDPAMLVYLDSATNRKAHPNENYARELMELFCLGEGNYSEKDVQELARCFTGWEIKSGKFRFNQFQHDSGSKTVLGKTGRFRGRRVDRLDSGTAAGGAVHRREVVSPVCLRRTGSFASSCLNPWQTNCANTSGRSAPSSSGFSAVSSSFPRTPWDARCGRPSIWPSACCDRSTATTNTHQLAADLQQNGQGLFFPPNVKGWDGGRTWINSSTILGSRQYDRPTDW